MKREFLEGLGIDKDKIDSIMGEHGRTLESYKTKSTDLQSSLDDLKTQLTQRDKDLKDLKAKAKDSEELQGQLTTLQDKYNTEKADYESKLKATQISSAVKLALSGKVHDAALATTLIDSGTIELDSEGNVTKGLDEQIKTLQESKPFLFLPENQKPKVKGASPAGGDPGNPDVSGTLGADFAKIANEKGAAASAANNPWG